MIQFKWSVEIYFIFWLGEKIATRIHTRLHDPAILLSDESLQGEESRVQPPVKNHAIRLEIAIHPWYRDSSTIQEQKRDNLRFVSVAAGIVSNRAIRIVNRTILTTVLPGALLFNSAEIQIGQLN